MISWLPIKGHFGYEVSDTGLVRRKRTGRPLKKQMNDNGYMRVGFPCGRCIKYERVNRLVATAFIPNPDNLPEVDHKDKDRTNDCKDNLEWVTSQENSDRACSCMYLVTRPDGATETVRNMRQFCLGHGLNPVCMGHVVSGRQKQHKGFTAIKLAS